MNIPTVTEDDLRDFHAKHFPNAPAPVTLFQAEKNHEEPNSDDDGLGYYTDGVKRTLTDEQIAMFRHSEFQRILRARRRRREEREERKRVGEPEHPNASDFMNTVPIPDTHCNDLEAQSTTTLTTNGQAKKKVLGRKGRASKRRRNQQRKKSRRKEAKSIEQNGGETEGVPGNPMDVDNEADDGHESEDGMSDEWDPKRQAKGPDNMAAANIDLEY